MNPLLFFVQSPGNFVGSPWGRLCKCIYSCIQFRALITRIHFAAQHWCRDDRAGEGPLWQLENWSKSVSKMSNLRKISLLLTALKHYFNMHIEKEHQWSISFVQCWVFHPSLVGRHRCPPHSVEGFKPPSTQWKSNSWWSPCGVFSAVVSPDWIGLWGSIRVTWGSCYFVIIDLLMMENKGFSDLLNLFVQP